MSNFNKKLKNYLTVYKVPIAPNSLDPAVFYFSEVGEEPRIHPGIHAQIINDMEILVSGQPARIEKLAIVGDIVIPGKAKRTSEIKVLVVINKNIKDIDITGIMSEELLKLANSLSNRLAVGTLHPINYYITVRDIDLNEHEAVYDIFNFRWLKLPSGIDNNQVYTRFKND